MEADKEEIVVMLLFELDSKFDLDTEIFEETFGVFV